MFVVKVQIVRWVDACFPGFVACELIDVHGRCWEFIEKVPVVSCDDLWSSTHYPQPGIIACEVVSRRVDEFGCEVVSIDTAQPWGVESVEGRTEFEVAAEMVNEWRAE